MPSTRHRSLPEDGRPFERSSLFGLVSFRPRTLIVLAALTLTVAIVAVHIIRESGPRRMDGMVSEGLLQFAASSREGGPDASLDPAAAEERISEIARVRVTLPRDDAHFSFRSVVRGKVGKSRAAALRLTYDRDPFLLLVVRDEPLGLGGGAEELFSGPGFISGEREGKSFVYWERDGATYFLVSGGDLTRTFDLVRRYFS